MVISHPLTILSENAELKWPTEPVTEGQKRAALSALSELAGAMTGYSPERNSALIESFMSTLPSQAGDDRNIVLRLANWHEVMTDVPTAALDAALKKHLKDSTDKFLPPPSQIRNLAKQIESQWLYRARMLSELAEAEDSRPFHLLSKAGMSFSAMTLFFKNARFEKRDVWIIWYPNRLSIELAESNNAAMLRKALGEYDFCIEGEEYVSREQRDKNLKTMGLA